MSSLWGARKVLRCHRQLNIVRQSRRSSTSERERNKFTFSALRYIFLSSPPSQRPWLKLISNVHYGAKQKKLPLAIIISKTVLFNGWRELRLLAFRFDLFEFIGARRKLSLQDASIKISLRWRCELDAERPCAVNSLDKKSTSFLVFASLSLPLKCSFELYFGNWFIAM